LIRVLHVIATLDRAGTEQQLAHLCRRLNRSEFMPAVCCLTRGGPLEAELKAGGVPVRILRKRGRWDLAVISRAMRVIRQFRPDILHTWLPTANTLGRTAGLAARVPVLIASERAADAWKGMLRRLADRLLTSYSARIITNSAAVRRFLAEQIGLPQRKIAVIRNGLDLDEFDAELAQAPANSLPAISGQPIIVGTVARLEPQKGIKFLIAAFSRLPRELGEVELWIVGGGPQERQLREEAGATRVTGRIRFLGHRPDVPALLARFDLFVLPSLWEGLPNAVLEAMAARRAVVATAVDGTPEAVEHEKTGLLVPPADAAALAAAIERLLRDPALRRAFGEAGRRKAASDFSMERMVAETEAVYRSAMEESAKRDRT